MLPDPMPLMQAHPSRLQRSSIVLLAPLALGLGVSLPAVAWAQEAEADTATAVEKGPIGFEADGVAYDSNNEMVTASGNVVLRRGEQEVRADSVTWYRTTGQIVATGNIRFTDAAGNTLYTPRMELTDELRAGAMQDMLMVFAEGGRMAARKGVRDEDGKVVLTDTAYSGCAVIDAQGCAKTPSWRVIANRVIYDPEQHRVTFKNARLELFGAPILPLPALRINTDGRGTSGVLIPDIRVSKSNGIEIGNTYYMRLAPNRDLALTGYAYSKTNPMLGVKYRALTENGAYQVTGFLTRSSRIPIESASPSQEKDTRGYVFANGRIQLSSNWSVTASARYASDRTFLRRYNISRDDRLRSMFDVERADANSYLSVSAWATQTLRQNDPQGQVPIALPIVDYRRRLANSVLGGRVEFQANSLAITRTDGQDTQRAFTSAKWELRRLTPMGQEITVTSLLRGDVYHSNDNGFTQTAIYRGQPGWQTRGIAVGAVDVKWPLIGEALGGTQVLTPRVQLVATPKIRNLDVPNEDSRAIDLEDSNLFALNRFPGYDRVEDGVRLTYGFDWQLDRPDWRIKTTVGQSYRLSSKSELLPDGTGLTSRFSDWVGRTEIRFKDFVQLTHRFRIDKDNLAVRRNEFDAAVGSKKTYVELSYLRLNRDIAAGIEDLKDREEVRASARIAFARYWSVFGSSVVNLTDKKEDPTFVSDGFEPLRTRLGIAYQDDCMDVGFTWRRDYARSGDARLGNTFQITFALRNLGAP
jgi:LPS-assembly protein